MKQWATKSEMKDGERMSYLAWNHLRLSYSDILEEYIKQIGKMSEHAFFASWNYCYIVKFWFLTANSLNVHSLLQIY